MRSRGRSRPRNSLELSHKDDTEALTTKVKKKMAEVPAVFKAGQNKSQRIKILAFLYFDGHKTFNAAVSGCLLLLFANQRCGDDPRSYECEWKDGLEKYHYKHWFRHGHMLDSIGMILNIVSVVLLCITFYYEFERENVFIDKLEVNKNRSQTDKDVKKALEKMSEYDLDIVFEANRKYQLVANITSKVMAVNVVVSTILLLFFHYYNFTTVTHLYQLLLYIYPKWEQITENACSSKYTFVSAYIKSKVHFNDCDPNVDVTLKKAT